MKNTSNKRNHIILGASSGAVWLLLALSAGAVEMHDAATHEQLAAAREMGRQTDPMKSLKPANGVDPSIANQARSFLAESDIISFGGISALVPKRAILQIPGTFTDRIKPAPGARLVGWKEFYAANRGWITTVEVSRVQAEGNQPMSKEAKTQMVRCGNLVVATYMGGPISVLPLKVQDTSTASASKP
jgi:hypothetical protein